jgi:hypothetical protein
MKHRYLRATIMRGQNSMFLVPLKRLSGVFLLGTALPVHALAIPFPGPYVSFGGQLYPFGANLNTGLLNSSPELAI